MSKNHLICVDAVTNDKGAGVGVGIVVSSTDKAVKTYPSLRNSGSRRAGLIAGLVYGIASVAHLIESGDRVIGLTVLDIDTLVLDDGSDPSLAPALASLGDALGQLAEKGITMELGKGNQIEMPSLGEATRLGALILLEGQSHGLV